MTQIVSDFGFSPLDNVINYEVYDKASETSKAIDLPSDADLNLFVYDLNQLKIIRIDFPSFADGRGFTLAKLVRIRGFKGHLRAKGHIISDQYAMPTPVINSIRTSQLETLFLKDRTFLTTFA